MTQDNSIDTAEVEIRKTYYPSGVLKWETPYVKGKMHGIAKDYYESGALRREIPCKNGKTDGIDKCTTSQAL